MIRYKLRTLLIVLAVRPPVLAVGWWLWNDSPIVVVWIVVMPCLALLPTLMVAAIRNRT